ncbi:alpha/beta hydrolase [Myxococcota bacterium]|nr:alpha/beta hydrolase [Myxococcota bacterium]
MSCARSRSAEALRVRALAALVALGVVAACGAEETATGPVVPYELDARPTLPFPTDALLVPDPATATGLRIALGPNGTNLGDLDEALFLFGEDFASALTRQDGWSTLAPVFAELSEAPDPATIEGHVLLVDLAAKRVVDTDERTFGGETSYRRPMHFVAARPPMPLAPKTRHAIVLTRGLTTAAGVPFVRAPTFDAIFRGAGDVPGEPTRVAAAKARLAGLADALAGAGITADDVLVADVFTTQSIAEETGALVDAYQGAEAPVIELDPDGDGAPNVYADPNDDPRWEGPASADWSALRAVARFTSDVPSFRVDVDGALLATPAGATRTGSERVEGLATIPKGAGPFPIVYFQHGLGDHKEQLWRWANELAARGIAMVAFDAPLHGARTDKPRSAGTNFINIVEPALVVDNFRQAEAEHTYLVRVIEAFADTELFDDGSTPLDATRLFWLGHSLGSMIGSVAVGLEPRYQGAVLIVGGGSLLEFFERILGGFELNKFPSEVFMSVAQTALDKGDPSNWAHLARTKQVLLLQAMEDEVMPRRATMALGRHLGLPQIAPIFEASPGATTVDAPIAGRGWAQYSPARHSLAYAPQNTPESFEAARARLFHYLGTWAATGMGEIR